MTGTPSASRRPAHASVALLIVAALVASVLGLIATGATGAGADTVPASPSEPRTVSADALPTVQINGVAWDQVIVGNTVYVTGQFTSARPAGAAAGTNETARTNLLAYNLTTGALITTWAPTINAAGKSIVASEDGSRIYVGGNFTQANGVTRSRIAAFNAATGALITTFNPNSQFRVNDLAVSSNTLYIVGAFTAMGGQARSRMAAVDATTGVVRPWAPSAELEVRTIVAPAGADKVIVGGHFTTINGVETRGMAALDPVTGALMPWPVNQILVNWGPDSAIYSLTTNGTSIFGTGMTYLVREGSGGNFEGTFSADVATGNLQWVTGCRGDHYDVAVAGGAVYDVSHTHDCAANGGNPQTEPWTFQYANAWSVNAAPNGATNNGGYFGGRPTPDLLHWLPTLSAGTFTGMTQAAWTVEGNDQYVILGGEFPRVNNAAQQGLVRFAVSEIAPDANGPQGGTEMTPTTFGIGPGTLRVSWKSAWDRDNERLTYELLRGSSLNNSTVVKTVTADTTWWNRPRLSFSDSTAPAGSTQTYRVRVTDPMNNVVVSSPATGVVPAGQAADSPYRTAVQGDSPISHWRLGEASGAFGYDQIGADDLAVEAEAVRGETGALLNDTDTATTFPGNGSTPASTTSAPTNGAQDFSVETWFKTTSTSGGKILGFGQSSSGNSSSYDRHVYMQDDGSVRFGVYDGNTRTIQSRAGLNDGQWHHVIGTMGPAGLHMYIDGKLVGRDPTATVAQNYAGYWRVGGDNLNGWPSQPSSSRFAGSIDEVAIYQGQLSIDQVRNHFLASGRSSNWPTRPSDTYGAAVWDSGATMHLRLDEPSGSDALDSISGELGANYADGAILGQAGSIAAPTGNSVGLGNTNDARVIGTIAWDNPQTFSIETWFKTTTTNGGRIMGFGNSRGATSSNYDRHIYMLNDGRIRYGIWVGSAAIIDSPQAYNDGQWHQVVATTTPGQQRLYVDGQLVGSGSAPGPQGYTGYWRLGPDNTWGGANTNSFAGMIDEASAYTSVLSAETVLGHWAAGGGDLPNVAPVAGFDHTMTDRSGVFTSTSTDSDGTIVNWDWDFGDDTVGSGSSLSHSYAAAGTYDVTLTVTDNEGAQHSTTIPVVATDPPPPNESPTAAFTIQVTDLTAMLTSTSADSDGSIVDWDWDFDDSTTGTGASIIHPFTAAGTYDVTLTITDDDGASSSVTLPVTVTDPPPLPNESPTAGFTIQVTDLTATLTSTSTDSDGTIVAWDWDFDDSSTGSGASVVHPFTAAGTYDVTLTVTDDDGAPSSVTLPVTVTDPPPPNAVPTAGFTWSATDLAASFTSTSTDTDGTIVAWDWTFGDNTVGTGATPNHTYATAGTYQVTLTVRDNQGATDAETLTVTVTAPAIFNYAQDSFTRTVVNGLGNAELGGAWTVSGGNTSFSVNGGVGRISVPIGASRAASLDGVQRSSTEVNTKISLDKQLTGGGTWLAVLGRRVNATNDYRMKLKLAATGAVTAQLVRTVGNVETVIQTMVVPGLTYSPNDVLRVRFQVSGVGNTQLSAKVWKDGAIEPATWQLNATDTTAVLQANGGVGVWTYLSGSATVGPMVVSIDDFVASPLLAN